MTIEQVWIQNPSGEYLELNLATSGEDEGLVVFSMEGLGSPAATVNGQGGPNFDGIRVSSVQVDARHIVLTLAVSETGYPEEEARKKIYNYFPIKQNILVGIKTDLKDVYTTAIVETLEMNAFAKRHKFNINCDHRRNWDGVTDQGATSPSGVYFFRLITPDGIRTHKAIRLR